MVVQELIDAVRIQFGNPDEFKEPLVLRRMNQILKQLIIESRVWEEQATLALAMGSNTATLPTDLNKLQFILAKDSNDDDVQLTFVEDRQLFGQAVITDAQPRCYYITNTQLVFDAQAQDAITLYLTYYKRLENSLTIGQDIQTEIPPFRDKYNLYLEEILVTALSPDGDIESVNGKILVLANLIQTDYEKEYPRRYIAQADPDRRSRQLYFGVSDYDAEADDYHGGRY